MLAGKHFVINTDENGRGRVYYRRYISRVRNLWMTVNVWCNPKRSGLGTRPVATVHPKLDGYLWMSRPGASAGPCPRSEPALLHARRAQSRSLLARARADARPVVGPVGGVRLLPWWRRRSSVRS